MSGNKGNNKHNTRLSMHSMLQMIQLMINDYPDIKSIKNMLLGINKNDEKKKQNNNKKINKRKTKMKILKHFKLFILPSILMAVTVTGLTLKNQKDIEENKPAFYEIPVNQSLEGNAEFFFTPEDDNRTWHVTNNYAPINTDDKTGVNNSEYTFSQETVTVVNNYVGYNSSEFFANK